jgi:hypothetical protein
MQLWGAVLGHQQRYEGLLWKAERDRLVLHELALRERRERFRRRVISWLGAALVAWGWRLQGGYAAGREVAVVAGASRPCCLISSGCQEAPKAR